MMFIFARLYLTFFAEHKSRRSALWNTDEYVVLTGMNGSRGLHLSLSLFGFLFGRGVFFSLLKSTFAHVYILALVRFNQLDISDKLIVLRERYMLHQYVDLWQCLLWLISSYSSCTSPPLISINILPYLFFLRGVYSKALKQIANKRRRIEPEAVTS